MECHLKDLVMKKKWKMYLKTRSNIKTKSKIWQKKIHVALESKPVGVSILTFLFIPLGVNWSYYLLVRTRINC